MVSYIVLAEITMLGNKISQQYMKVNWKPLVQHVEAKKAELNLDIVSSVIKLH